MKLPHISEMLVVVGTPLREALTTIDRPGQGVAFVVDRDGRLTGLLTDGDVRRAMLSGGGLDSLVETVMRRDFIVRPVGTPDSELSALLNHRIRHIPLTDPAGRPVDYACRFRFHSTPILEPVLEGRELEYLSECVRSGWVSSRGRFIGEFEDRFREFVGAPEAVAVSNGTTALHLALATLGVGPGDEVVVPDLTFGACANAVLQCGATPAFADVEADTWGISRRTVEPLLSERTRAVMAVHLYGHACDLDPLLDLCRSRGIPLVEDCAEALGSRYKGCHVGSFGEAATFSFFGNKTVTTGEGGMVLFRDAKAAGRARMLRDHGMDPARRYWHLEPGFNYRMTNMQAALGVAQMERGEALVAEKRKRALRYREALQGIEGLTLPPEADWAVNSYWLFTVLLPRDAASRRDEIIARLQTDGVETRPAFYPLRLMPAFKGRSRFHDCVMSTALSARGLSLPSSVSLTEEEQDRVTRSFAASLKALKAKESRS